jgi:hypothetical protein
MRAACVHGGQGATGPAARPSVSSEPEIFSLEMPPHFFCMATACMDRQVFPRTRISRLLDQAHKFGKRNRDIVLESRTGACIHNVLIFNESS